MVAMMTVMVMMYDAWSLTASLAAGDATRNEHGVPTLL